MLLASNGFGSGERAQPAPPGYMLDAYTAGELLEALGYLYGAMGYSLDGDLGDFGALGDAPPAPVSKDRWEKIGKRLRARIRKYAGMNVPKYCPSEYGDKRRPQYAEERGRGRWICRDPKRAQHYAVWNRKPRTWDERLLQCPAVRGWGRKTKVPCQEVSGGGNIFTTVARGIKKGAETVAKVALTPLKFVMDLPLKILMKAAIPIARAICRFPEPAFVSIAAAQMPGTHPNHIRAVRTGFCEAINIRNLKEVRKLLPEILKISIKVAGSASIPGLGPALDIARAVPGLSKVVSFSGAGETERDPIELLNALSYAQIARGLSSLSDADLAEGLGLTSSTAQKMAGGALVGVLLGAAGYGIYAATRD